MKQREKDKIMIKTLLLPTLSASAGKLKFSMTDHLRNNAIGLLLIAILLQGCGYRVPEPESIQIEGIANSVRVGELLIASQPSESALRTLAEQGVATVISTRGESELGWSEKVLVESLGMNFSSIPMAKPIVGITDEQVGSFAKLMDSATQPILLHCGSGNRASALWAVWLVEHKGLNTKEAIRLAGLTGLTSLTALVEDRLRVADGNKK